MCLYRVSAQSGGEMFAIFPMTAIFSATSPLLFKLQPIKTRKEH